VGHGKIWTAMLAVLAIEPIPPGSDAVLRASALSLVYGDRDLISRANPASLSALFERSVAYELIMKALQAAPLVDESVKALTAYVSAHSARLLQMQTAYLDRAQLFWSSGRAGIGLVKQVLEVSAQPSVSKNPCSMTHKLQHLFAPFITLGSNYLLNALRRNTTSPVYGHRRRWGAKCVSVTPV